MELPEFALRAFTEAESQFSQGNYQGAIDRIDQSLLEFDGDVLLADALNNKGFYLLHLGRWEEAIASFEKAYLTDPSFTVILCHLAWTALLINNLEGAGALMEMFEKQETEYQALHQRNKALLHLNLGNPQEALVALKLAEEEDPYLEYLDLLSAKIQETDLDLSAYPETDLQARYISKLPLPI